MTLLTFSKKGEKIGIVGSNGVGKSTFLNIITQQQKADSGKVTTGQTIRYGYYTQNGLQEKEDMRVIDIIKEVAESIKLNNSTELSASLFLTYFGFSTDIQYNYYANLSGGERRRLYLLKVLISNPNFLILDEPTNDLDIYNLGVLENFLKEYKGCLLIVSHDRSFMDNLVDHLFVFEGEGKVSDYHSNYSDYVEKKTPARKKLSFKRIGQSHSKIKQNFNKIKLILTLLLQNLKANENFPTMRKGNLK